MNARIGTRLHRPEVAVRGAARRIDARIQRVLDHGQYIMGPEVTELEDKLAAFTGAKHCITVASGTEALLIALMALGHRSPATRSSPRRSPSPPPPR